MHHRSSNVSLQRWGGGQRSHTFAYRVLSRTDGIRNSMCLQFKLFQCSEKSHLASGNGNSKKGYSTETDGLLLTHVKCPMQAQCIIVLRESVRLSITVWYCI